MAGQSRIEFLQAQTLAAASSVAHGIALKRYSSACGRRDLRTEALVSSDESEDSDAGIMVSDEDSEAGSMLTQSSSSVKAKEPLKPSAPPRPGPDALHIVVQGTFIRVSYMRFSLGL